MTTPRPPRGPNGSGPQRPAAKQRPQVALESTLYAFGLPRPRNVQVAWTLARAVAATGAEARTFAVIDGEIKVGLHDDELERVASGEGVIKLSASDIGPAMALGLTGATTVSATCALAHGASIPVFATGGIGGVHRGAGETFDESQDLWALARYPVAVVSAGAKAVLDLPKTLERLESLGVPVIGYRTDELPAFYTRESGLKVHHRVEDTGTLARLLAAHWRVHPNVGVLVANPIPEEAALDRVEIEEAIDKAIAEAEGKGIAGKALTPFLLQRLEELTEGRSVEANVALAESNAGLAGKLAVELERVREALQ